NTANPAAIIGNFNPLDFSNWFVILLAGSGSVHTDVLDNIAHVTRRVPRRGGGLRLALATCRACLQVKITPGLRLELARPFTERISPVVLAHARFTPGLAVIV